MAASRILVRRSRMVCSPPVARSVARGRPGEGGRCSHGPVLLRKVSALNARAQVSLLCHSYGTVVCAPSRNASAS
ncbi:hypothetical protein FE633_44780 [Streptomyces montanus]|uniref:DUF1023 domain-containing protein n=1 Tax=Streptomyces montanus TaxID=2580423 RepID=A0A5R9F9V3_9ACTN|nr:hypothetical protein FE633_44780 [Streptomyces montanus]